MISEQGIPALGQFRPDTGAEGRSLDVRKALQASRRLIAGARRRTDEAVKALFSDTNKEKARVVGRKAVEVSRIVLDKSVRGGVAVAKATGRGSRAFYTHWLHPFTFESPGTASVLLVVAGYVGLVAAPFRDSSDHHVTSPQRSSYTRVEPILESPTVESARVESATNTVQLTEFTSFRTRESRRALRPNQSASARLPEAGEEYTEFPDQSGRMVRMYRTGVIESVGQ